MIHEEEREVKNKGEANRGKKQQKQRPAWQNILKAATAGKGDIYWVASRQTVGQELLQKYAVPEVPAGVVILGDGMYVSHVLSNSVYDQLNGTEDVQMDTYALDRLLELQEMEK